MPLDRSASESLPASAMGMAKIFRTNTLTPSLPEACVHPWRNVLIDKILSFFSFFQLTVKDGLSN